MIMSQWTPALRFGVILPILENSNNIFKLLAEITEIKCLQHKTNTFHKRDITL